jgi:hypothetical protein
MGFLTRSAALYDAGEESEAKRLATTIRILVHESTSSRSLLGQLGLLDLVEFADSADPISAANLLPTLGLLVMRVSFGEGAGAVYMPRLDASPVGSRPRRFRDWWADPVTSIPGRKLSYSRRDYVLGTSDREGGAHVDANVDAMFAALTDENALGWIQRDGDAPGRRVGNDPLLAGVRHIAYEVSRSLEESPMVRAALEAASE